MEYAKEIRKKIGHDLLVVVGSCVIILDNSNRLLLQKRRDGSWGLLGGLLDIEETLEEAAIREVYEEANLTVSNLELLHVFSGPTYHFKLPNLDEVYVITALYYAGEVTGDMRIDHDESLDLQYFDVNQLPENIRPEYQSFIDFYINQGNLKE